MRLYICPRPFCGGSLKVDTETDGTLYAICTNGHRWEKGQLCGTPEIITPRMSNAKIKVRADTIRRLNSEGTPEAVLCQQFKVKRRQLQGILSKGE